MRVMIKKLFSNSFIFISVLILSVFIATGCEQTDKPGDNVNNDGKIKVYTSIYPLEYLVGEIAKDRAEVENIVPLGSESHDFEPTGKEVAMIKESDLFIFIGSGMESWGDKLADDMDDKIVLEASKFVDLIDLDEDDAENHEHSDDSDDEHDHHGTKDPHIWMSPGNMVKVAEEIKNRLSVIDEENSEEYNRNYEVLLEKLNGLDEKYESELIGRKKDTFLVSHKAFSYLARDYGLKQISVTGVTPFSEPSPKTIANLINTAKEENLSYIYFETLASPKSVKTIADEAKLESLTLNPLEGLTEEDKEKNKDYISIMEENLESLKKELMK